MLFWRALEAKTEMVLGTLTKNATGAISRTRRSEVSVVIPCLNEANSVGICVDKAIDGVRGGGPARGSGGGRQRINGWID